MARVLVVEDDGPLRGSIQTTLRRLGLDVDTAASKAEGDSLIRTRRYDAFLVDVRLGDGNGLDLMPSIRHYHPGAEPYALSGDIWMLEPANAAGASFILKPKDVVRMLGDIAARLRARTGTFARPPRDDAEPPTILVIGERPDLGARTQAHLEAAGIAATIAIHDGLDRDAKEGLAAAVFEAVLIDDPTLTGQHAIDAITWMQTHELRLPIVVRSELAASRRPSTIALASYWRRADEGSEIVIGDVVDAIWVMGHERGLASRVVELAATRFPSMTPKQRELLELLARLHPEQLAHRALGLEESGLKTRIGGLRSRLGLHPKASLGSVIDALRRELINGRAAGRR